MVFDVHQPGAEVIEFLTQRHLATLTTLDRRGDPQVTPVGVTYDPATATARVITWADSMKARNVTRSPGQRVAVCQVDGGRWLSLYGSATVSSDPDEVAEAVERYTARYRPPKKRHDRVVIVVSVDRITGRA